MSAKIVVRYFYTDAPSPLHDAIAKMAKQRRAAIAKAKTLAKEIGARLAHGEPTVVGFSFASPPGEGWMAREFRGGDGEYYVPKKTSKAGKALLKRMEEIEIPGTAFVLEECGLTRLVIDDRNCSLVRSSVGWSRGRVFVRIPFGRDRGADAKFVPHYLTECKEWEKDKWFDEGEGRAAA